MDILTLEQKEKLRESKRAKKYGDIVNCFNKYVPKYGKTGAMLMAAKDLGISYATVVNARKWVESYGK